VSHLCRNESDNRAASCTTLETYTITLSFFFCPTEISFDVTLSRVINNAPTKVKKLHFCKVSQDTARYRAVFIITCWRILSVLRNSIAKYQSIGSSNYIVGVIKVKKYQSIFALEYRHNYRRQIFLQPFRCLFISTHPSLAIILHQQSRSKTSKLQ
jgi:hypothetical protein